MIHKQNSNIFTTFILFPDVRCKDYEVSEPRRQQGLSWCRENNIDTEAPVRVIEDSPAPEKRFVIYLGATERARD